MMQSSKSHYNKATSSQRYEADVITPTAPQPMPIVSKVSDERLTVLASKYGEHTPVIEIGQKARTRSTKRTQRDRYRYTAHGKEPIEFQYVASTTSQEETNVPSSSGMIEQHDSSATTSASSSQQQYYSSNSTQQSDNAVTNDATIECSVASDGLLVIKLKGKPDKVPLDAQFLPVTLPEGWELREIQTNQRCRSTKRSRKTRINNKVHVSESRVSSSQQQLQQQTESEATSKHSDLESRKNELMRYAAASERSQALTSGHHSSGGGGSGPVGHHSDEEFEEGQRGNIAYTTKIRRSITDGPYGSSSLVQKGHTEKSIDEQQQPSRGGERTNSTRHTLSTLERHSSSKSEFSKQVVKDEKTTVVNRSHTERYGNVDGGSAVQIINNSSSNQQQHLNNSIRKQEKNRDFQHDFNANNDDIRTSSRQEQHHADFSSTKSLSSSGMVVNKQQRPQQQHQQERSHSSAAHKIDREWSMSELKADDDDYRHSSSHNTLLDTSLQRARADVGHSGTMAQRRPPSRHTQMQNRSSAATAATQFSKSEAALLQSTNVGASSQSKVNTLAGEWKSDERQINQQQRHQSKGQQQKTIHHVIETAPSPMSPSPRVVELTNNGTVSSSASSTHQQRYSSSRNEDNSTVIVVPPISPSGRSSSSIRGGIVTSPDAEHHHRHQQQQQHTKIAVGVENSQQKLITLGTRAEQQQIQHSNDVHNSGFTRITKSDGGSGRRAHERFTYAQQEDRQHEVTISYGTPASGMQQIKYVVEKDDVLLNQEAQMQSAVPPEEKIRFREEMNIPQKEISVTFGVDEKKFKPPPPLLNKVPTPSSSSRRSQSAQMVQQYEAKNTINVGSSTVSPAPPLLEKQKLIRFNETREKAMGEVSVMVGVQVPAPPAPKRRPTSTQQESVMNLNERIRFSETIQLPPKEVSLTFGVQPSPRPPSPIQQQQEQRTVVDLQEKVTFADERTIAAEKVAVVFGIQQPPPSPSPPPPPFMPPPMREKFVFHDDVRLAQKEVAIKFAVEQPPSPPQSPAVPQVSGLRQKHVDSSENEERYQIQRQITYGKIESKQQSLALSTENETDEEDFIPTRRPKDDAGRWPNVTETTQQATAVVSNETSSQVVEKSAWTAAQSFESVESVSDANLQQKEVGLELLAEIATKSRSAKPVIRQLQLTSEKEDIFRNASALAVPARQQPRIVFGKVESKAEESQQVFKAIEFYAEEETDKTINKRISSPKNVFEKLAAVDAQKITVAEMTAAEQQKTLKTTVQKQPIVFGKVESVIRQNFAAKEVASQSQSATTVTTKATETEKLIRNATSSATSYNIPSYSVIPQEALTETLENVINASSNIVPTETKKSAQSRIAFGKVESIENEGLSFGRVARQEQALEVTVKESERQTEQVTAQFNNSREWQESIETQMQKIRVKVEQQEKTLEYKKVPAVKRLSFGRVESSKTSETLQTNKTSTAELPYEVTLPLSPPIVNKTVVLEKIKSFTKRQLQQQQDQHQPQFKPYLPLPPPPPNVIALQETFNPLFVAADVIETLPVSESLTTPYTRKAHEELLTKHITVVQSTRSARRREKIVNDYTESEGESTDERAEEREIITAPASQPSDRPAQPPKRERRERLERSSSSSSGSDENETVMKSSKVREDVKIALEEIMSEKILETTNVVQSPFTADEHGVLRLSASTTERITNSETLTPRRIRRESLQKSSSSSEGSDDGETVIKLSRKRPVPPLPLPVMSVPVTSDFPPSFESESSFTELLAETASSSTFQQNVFYASTNTEHVVALMIPTQTIRRSSLTEEFIETAVSLAIPEIMPPEKASSSQRSRSEVRSYEINTITSQILPPLPPPPPPEIVIREEEQKFSEEIVQTTREEEYQSDIETVVASETATEFKTNEILAEKLQQHQTSYSEIVQQEEMVPDEIIIEKEEQIELQEKQQIHQKQRFISELTTTPAANLNASTTSILSGFEYSSVAERPQSEMRLSSGFDYIASVAETPSSRLRYRSGSTYNALVPEVKPSKRARVRSGFEYRAPSDERSSSSSNKVRRLSGSSYSAEAEHITFQRSKMTAGASYQTLSGGDTNVFQMKPSRSISGYLYQASVNEVHKPPPPPPLQLGKIESKERERSPPPSPIPSPISVSPPRQPSPPPKPRVRTELEMKSNPDDLLCAQGKYGFAYTADSEQAGRRSRNLSGFEYGTKLGDDDVMKRPRGVYGYEYGAPVGEQKPKNPRGIYGYDYSAPVGDELIMRNPRDIYGFTYRAMVDANERVQRPLTPPPSMPENATRIQSDPMQRKRARSSPPPERRPLEFHIKEQINYNKKIQTEEVFKLRSQTTEPTRVIVPPPPPPPTPPREPTPPPMEEYSTIEKHLYHELSSDTIKTYVEPHAPPPPPPPPAPPAVTEHRYRIETIKRYELPVDENDGTVPDLDTVNPTAVRQVIRRLVNGEWKDVAASELAMLGGYPPRSLPTIEEQSAASHGGSSNPSSSDDDETVVEETTTTRRIRRVEETEELIGKRR